MKQAEPKDELKPPELTRQEGCGLEMPKFEFHLNNEYDDLPPISEYIDFSLPPRRLWIGTGVKEVAAKERTFKSLNKNPNMRSPLIPKRQLNGFLCMDGTLQVTKTTVVCTRALYSGQFLAYMMPGGRHDVVGITGPRSIDHAVTKALFNLSKETVLTVSDVDDYHFSTRLRFTSSLLIANCCLCDDTRITVLENIYLNSDNGEQVSATNTVELICYLGNWTTAG